MLLPFVSMVAGTALAIAIWLYSRNRLNIVDKLQYLLIFAGPVIAGITVTVLALVAPNPPHPGSDAEFQFGDIEGVFSMTILCFNLLVNVVLLMTMKNGDGSLDNNETNSDRAADNTIATTYQDIDPSLNEPEVADIEEDMDEKEPNEDVISETAVKKIKQKVDIQLVRHKFLLLLLILSVLIGNK